MAMAEIACFSLLDRGAFCMMGNGVSNQKTTTGLVFTEAHSNVIEESDFVYVGKKNLG